MSDVDQIPASAALVLRDRTNAEPQQVFVTALGAWTHRRGPAPRGR